MHSAQELIRTSPYGPDAVYLNFISQMDIKISRPQESVTVRRTEGQTDRIKPICPFNFFEVGGMIHWIDLESPKLSIKSQPNSFLGS